MAITPWPEWLPDQADFGSAGSPVIKNCVPLTAGSYGPMPTAVPWSANTLDLPCQGSYSLRGPDGLVHIFAGDKTKLYMVPPASTTLTDVSRTTGGPYNTPPTLLTGGHWSMTSYGDRIIAANGIDQLQTMVLGATHFTALQPGAVGPPVVAAAPVAKFVAVVKDFVMVGNTTDAVDGPRPYRVWWSGINSPQAWPVPGSTEALQLQSDYNDLMQTDLGNVTQLISGFSPGSDCVIFCERGIYTATYTGPPLLFSF